MSDQIPEPPADAEIYPWQSVQSAWQQGWRAGYKAALKAAEAAEQVTTGGS